MRNHPRRPAHAPAAIGSAAPGGAPAAFRWLRPIAAAGAIALAALAGCSDGATEPKDEKPVDVTGTYELTDVGGNGLPVTIYEGPWNTGGQQVQVRVAVVGGVIELTDDGEYLIALGLTAEMNGDTQPLPLIDEGEFSVDGSRIVFESDDPEIGTWEGVVKADALSIGLDLLAEGHSTAYRFER